MSAIHMRCLRCRGRFIAGMVGITPWPPHVCPDGTKGAPAEFAPWPSPAPVGVPDTDEGAK